MRTRTSTAKPAALEAVETKAVIGVGAPSYTSGAQKWNGTIETLKPKPTSTRISAPASTQTDTAPARKRSAKAYRLVAPAKP